MQFLAEIWTKILRKTDLLTGLTYGDLLAAEPFLFDQQGAMDTAIAADHRIGIGPLLRHGIGLLSPATAALNGNLNLMQRILARGDFNDCTEDRFTEVVKRGYLDVLKWSHKNLGHLSRSKPSSKRTIGTMLCWVTGLALSHVLPAAVTTDPQ